MAELLYSARLELRYAIERGRNNLLRCPTQRSGVAAAPTSGTFTLRDPGGTVIVTGAVSIVASVAEFTVTSASVAAYAYGDGWSTEWALTMPDGAVHTFRNGAALVRIAPHPVVTDGDLYRRVSSLNPAGAACITSLTTYQDYIDEAWTEICRRLLQADNRPWLIVDPTDLREPHQLLTYALIFEDLTTRLDAAYAEQGKLYRSQFLTAWGAVKLTYDFGENGGSSATKRPARAPGFFLGSRR